MRCSRCGCFLREGSDARRVRCDPCYWAIRSEALKGVKSRVHPARKIREARKHIVFSKRAKKLQSEAAKAKRESESDEEDPHLAEIYQEVCETH